MFPPANTDLEVTREDGYFLSTDFDKLDYERICDWISTDCYWAIGRPHNVIRGSIEHSLPFGVYIQTPSGEWEQVAVARVVTDYCTPPIPPPPNTRGPTSVLLFGWEWLM